MIGICAGILGCSPTKKEIEQNWVMFNKAKEHGDHITCVAALNRIMVLDQFNLSVYDTLARIYFQSQMYVPAYNVSKKALAYNPNSDMLVIAGDASEKVGKTEEAIGYYERIVASKPDDIATIYKIATANFNLGKSDLAKPHLKKVINNERSKEIGLNFNNEGRSQTIPYYSAALNVLGFIEMQDKNYPNAETVFMEALKRSPNFVLAKNNLSALQQLVEQEK